MTFWTHQCHRTKSNQRWMKLRTTVQISSAIAPKKPTLKREDSFLKRFSTRQIPETQVSLCFMLENEKRITGWDAELFKLK